MRNRGWINHKAFSGGIVGIFESEIASSAQLKGAEIVVAGFGGSKIETDNESCSWYQGLGLGLCGYGCRGGWGNDMRICLN